jgi:hypothetical protein
MRGLVTAAFVGLSLLSGCVRPLWAQSLGDLAKQEEERRKTVKPASKVYTNKDLGNAPPPPAPSPAAAQTATAGAPGTTPTPAGQAGSTGQTSPAGQTDPAGQTAPAKDSAAVQKDQTYWAGRVKDLNTQLDRDQTFASALEAQVNTMTADFVSRSDPAQRSIIEQNRAKALSEFARLQNEIEKDKKAITDLEEEARRAGVPPGWLR